MWTEKACYQEFSSGSDLILRMLQAGREQSGVRLIAETQVMTQGGQFKIQEASLQSSHDAQKYSQGLPG